MKGWLNYFRTVRSRIVLDRGFARALWVVPWLAAKARGRRKAETARIAYHPQPAGPWYTLPLSLTGTGVRQTKDLARADVVMIFDDRTDAAPDLPDLDVPMLNARIADISKARVGRVFERVFGYALAVDPTRHSGPMVEKSDINGVHDGRIVQGPLAAPVTGMAYQRLVESTVRDGVTDEFRCTCVGGAVSAVVRKEKASDTRFAASYLHTHPVDPAEVFTPSERALLTDFLDAMGLDFGSIDVLRDYPDEGRLYVVDVNKTCMPVLSMNVRDLDATLATIGAAAEAFILKQANRAS